MITVSMLTTFAAIDFALVLYAFWDNDNRNFTHVYASLISIVLSGTLAYFLLLGLVSEITGDGVLTTVTDTPFAYFFIFIGVIMLVYTILSALEAATGAAQPNAGWDDE